uniref:Uncharacterized protein n=1 Tax=Syphacia muris TaxID=451379 RepID=A0A0N5APS4_9BILA
MSTSSKLFFAALAKLQNPLSFQQPQVASDAVVEATSESAEAAATAAAATVAAAAAAETSASPTTIAATVANETESENSVTNNHTEVTAQKEIKPTVSTGSKRRRKPDGKPRT